MYQRAWYFDFQKSYENKKGQLRCCWGKMCFDINARTTA